MQFHWIPLYRPETAAEPLCFWRPALTFQDESPRGNANFQYLLTRQHSNAPLPATCWRGPQAPSRICVFSFGFDESDSVMRPERGNFEYFCLMSSLGRHFLLNWVTVWKKTVKLSRAIEIYNSYFFSPVPWRLFSFKLRNYNKEGTQME